MHFEFNVFRARPAHVRIQVDSIRDFRHEPFRKPHRPSPVVILEYGAKCEPARVRGVVVRSVIVHSPVHELEISVAAVAIQIEKIRHAEFAEANFQPSHGQRAKERERRSRRSHFLSAQRNDLMPQ